PQQRDSCRPWQRPFSTGPSLRLLRDDRQLEPVGVAQNGDGRACTDPLGDEQAVQVVDPRYGLPVETDDDVPGREPRACRRAVRLHTGHQHAALRVDPERPLRQPEQGNVLPRDPDPAAADLAVPDQLAGHDLRRLDAHGAAAPPGGKGGTRLTARSVSGSSPTSAAGTGRPSANATSMRVASCTTWLFVRTNPSGVNTNPEPLPGTSRAGRPRRSTRCRTSTLTTAGP